MTYTVDWLPDAEEELAAIWLAASDRGAVTGAAHRIDLRLRDNPEEQCESRSGGRRILFDKPLGVLFHVNASERHVNVVHVWAFR
jgi:plasmid stabilization system protein ParE